MIIEDHQAFSAPVLVEACVTSVDEAVTSVRAGAHRLELCRNLEVGGLTPPLELLRSVREAVDVPVFAMARPRPGPFVFDGQEVEQTVEEIVGLRDAGAHGIVVGALTVDGLVDEAAVEKLVKAAGGLPVTFHRAFDELPDLLGALDRLAGLGVSRVLTSGGASTALGGAATLAALVKAGGDRVEILAGGRVRGDHIRKLVETTGVREVHARASAIVRVVEALGD